MSPEVGGGLYHQVELGALLVEGEGVAGVLVVIRPSTTTLSAGTKRSGSKVPDRSSSYSRK
jgi:hypothetical protein